MKRDELTARLAGLPSLTTAQLRAEWKRAIGEDSPAAFGKDMLARGIAYHLQKEMHGGLRADTARQLAQARKQIEQGRQPNPRTRLRPGTQLARDWRGRTHHVLVLEDGYLFEEKHYRSLSVIARTITGARWSGPRFFGLVSMRGEANREAA